MNIHLNVLEYEIPSDHRPIICAIDNASVEESVSVYYNYKLTDCNINNKININPIMSWSKAAIDSEIEKFVELVEHYMPSFETEHKK